MQREKNHLKQHNINNKKTAMLIQKLNSDSNILQTKTALPSQAFCEDIT